MAAPEQHRRMTDESQEHDSQDRRSTADNDTPHRRRKQDLLRKYRQPLIGLGLAGAAMPLVNATASVDQPDDSSATNASADPRTATASGADAEEALVGKIAESRAVDARQQHIKAAMEEFGIEEDLATDIYDIAKEEGVDAKVAYGLVRTESTFNERAVSHVGARGLTQVMPRTAKWLVPGTTAQDLFNRKTNLRLGFSYLTQLTEKYSGDLKLALLAYNRGPGTVDKVLKRGGNPDNGYAAKVLGG